MKKREITLAIVLFLVVSLLLSVLMSGETHYEEVETGFNHNGNRLEGSIILPKNGTGPFPAVLFVHGDGAMPYDAFGYYRVLWNRLAENGIASYSWSKAGVGGSSGNWQLQSMDERAEEVLAAIDMLQQQEVISPEKIGLLGYSQAGWVIPLVSTKSDLPHLAVIVSGAINWMDQGRYLMRKRLEQRGHGSDTIEQALSYLRRSTAILTPATTYETYLQFRKEYHPEILNNGSGTMTRDRFLFAKANWQYDARQNLKDIQCPMLAVFGEDDLNVDYLESARVYGEEFALSGNTELTIKTFTNAQHSLLKNEYFNEIVPGLWTLIKMEVLGDDAYAEGYLDFVAGWIEQHFERLN